MCVLWQNLADIALQLGNLRVAERCYAALGDMSRTHYLRETLELAAEFANSNGQYCLSTNILGIAIYSAESTALCTLF